MSWKNYLKNEEEGKREGKWYRLETQIYLKNITERIMKRKLKMYLLFLIDQTNKGLFKIIIVTVFLVVYASVKWMTVMT